MKLKTKIQIFSSLFMIVLLLLVNTSIYYLFNYTSLKNELEKLSAQTNTMIEALNKNPNISQGELLQAHLPANGMIRVYQEDGEQIVPTITKRKIYSELPGEFSKTESREVITDIADVNVAVVSKPIIWDAGDIVTLQVTQFLNLQKDTMKTLFYVLIIASILMLIPTIIASTFLSKFLVEPIKSLIDTMKINTSQSKWEKINTQSRSHDELYEMEETFNAMIDQLKDNFDKQAIFVSDASHELKTPISIVKSYAQLLKRRGKQHPDLFDESVDAIATEADRMQKLVEQMLLLAKNEQELKNKKVDIVQLCEEVVLTFERAYSRLITLNKESDHMFVSGNRDQLEQVIYILIDNALKYSDKEVLLNVFIEGSSVVIHVIDYGQGIDENDLPHLFDRFYRVDKARNRETGGTGLGLAIAKVITESHKGKINLNSKVNIGTTFIVTLPSEFHEYED